MRARLTNHACQPNLLGLALAIRTPSGRGPYRRAGTFTRWLAGAPGLPEHAQEQIRIAGMS